MGTTLAIGDTHFPFQHKDTFEFLYAIKEKYTPTTVVHMGDLLDFHALSDYDPDPDGDGPGEEFRKGMGRALRLYTIFPEARLCYSNHDARPYRRAYKHGIPTTFLRSYKEWMQLPEGWEIGQKWIVDDVLYEHGEGASGQYGHLRSAERNMRSTVIGHIHSHAGINYIANPRYLIFGFNVGCLIDKDTYAMSYGRHMKSRPVLGAGIIQDGIPTFIPMQLRKGGRWIGRL
jgi:hypothetical protein